MYQSNGVTHVVDKVLLPKYFLVPSPVGAAACGFESACADLDRPKKVVRHAATHGARVGARAMQAAFKRLPLPTSPWLERESEGFIQLPEPCLQFELAKKFFVRLAQSSKIMN